MMLKVRSAPNVFWTYCRKRYYTTIANTESKKIVSSGDTASFKERIASGPSLAEFINKKSDLDVLGGPVEPSPLPPYISASEVKGKNRKVYIETYGCQMNVNDTEIASSILKTSGFMMTKDVKNADVVLIMTCAIREGAEQKIWNRLEHLKALKRKREASSQQPLKIGILGCMAERLKRKLIEKEKMVDIVAGPDSYRDLPNLLSVANEGQTAVNVMLSMDETYADVIPVRTNPLSKSAFVSIMRGCDNMCTYCIVPYTRGRERSRPITSILDEVKLLSDQGYKEITLLGQNVNSYRDLSESSQAMMIRSPSKDSLSKGFHTVYKTRFGGMRFADLLYEVANVDPELRIRFTSPHPKDFPDEVLQVIKEKVNVCNQIHLPAQSGNSEVLERMRRGHTREAYLELVKHIRNIIPGIALTSDFICGFCGETEEAHQDTLSLVENVKYEFAYVFPYSMRQRTHAYYDYKDDVPEEVKIRRAEEVTSLFRAMALQLHQKQIGRKHLVLVEGPSKRSKYHLAGKNDGNTKVIFPLTDISDSYGSENKRSPQPGDYVVVKVDDCTSQVLKGKPLYFSTLEDFYKKDPNQDFQNIICDYDDVKNVN